MKRFIVATSAALIAAAAQAQSPQLVKKWESKAELKVPESVYFDEKRKTLYVSNIDGEPWGDDKKGSIGKLDLDGTIVAVDWVTGLSAPKGMALHDNLLYVGDMSEVVVIDVEKGKIAKRIAVPGAEGLNDVTVDDKGVIYVSDSKASKVFAIRDGEAKVHIDNLKGPNGVLYHNGSLYLTDGGKVHRASADGKLEAISESIEGGLDGIEPVSEDEFLLSVWQGTVYYISADGSAKLLLDTAASKTNAADIGYDAKNRIVYVPTFFKNSVVAYQLK